MIPAVLMMSIVAVVGWSSHYTPRSPASTPNPPPITELDHIEAVENLFTTVFKDDPRNPKDAYELDTYEQCSALQDHISKERGFKVVIPPCVALGFQKYE